jgi:hypothetical protein
MKTNDLHRIYKQETGYGVNDQEVGLRRTRGQWLLEPDEVGDLADEYVFENFGYTARIWFPDPDYVRWLEDKLMELIIK